MSKYKANVWKTEKPNNCFRCHSTNIMIDTNHYVFREYKDSTPLKKEED